MSGCNCRCGHGRKRIISKLVKVSSKKIFVTCSLFGWLLLFRNLLYSTNDGHHVMDRGRQVIPSTFPDPLIKLVNISANTTSVKVHAARRIQIPLNRNGSNINKSILQRKVFIYSAIAVNSTAVAHAYWDNIVLNGWENPVVSTTNYSCCIVYGKFSKGATLRPCLVKRSWNYVGKAKFDAKQWVCPNVRKEIPSLITLSAKKLCPYSERAYVKVEPAYKQQTGYFGVCGKIIYGNIAAASIIEWFEFQRLMNVSKIMLYTSDLNVEATRVLEYYRSIGLVELFPFELGGIEIYPRLISVKNFQGWNDEQVTVFDCQSRMSGVTYIALYDLDEFIYPFHHKNYTQLMYYLTAKFSRAAGFTFRSEIYITTWNQNHNQSTSGLILPKYTQRTGAMQDRVKNFILMDRLEPGRMSTHGFWVKKGFKKTVVPDTIAVIKHYRSCRKEWMKNDGEKCFKTIQRIEDSSMLPVAQRIAPRVDDVRKRLRIGA